MQLAATGYGTGSTSPRWLGFSLILHNTHPTLAAAHARYQAAAYDASGAVLQTESGYIELVLPGHRLGASDTMLLGEGQTAARVEVHISPPRMVEPQGQQPLGVENIAIVEEGFGVRAAGLVTNAYDRDLRDVRVSAVPYDAQGNIIGGGFTYLDIIPAGAQAPVSVDLIAPGRPARVELYPMPTILSR